ncbi:hypothetical protein F0562_004754 [Nyssa sinensis]|uniref:RNase H type-1 domain-containing protein n=1 Tax=Nyssa sinensis TaxID=561372 RepID=A0A5J5AG70_9ASTE|nr:hypothetical protein F0562_004754 [Nyssa sinensis]
MVPGLMRWDFDKLTSFFLPREVEDIRRIPLGLKPTLDKLIWHFSSNKIFSVKCRVVVNFLSDVMVGKSKWKAPEVGLFKLNIDGSWSDSDGRGGVGGLVRDCQGEVIEGFGKMLVDCGSATQVEMFAILHGLIFAKEIGIHDIILEGDSLNSLLAIKSPLEDFSSLGIYVEEVNVAFCFFNWISYAHVRREANAVAHVLACYAKGLENDVF